MSKNYSRLEMSEHSVCLRSYFHTMTAKPAFSFGSLDLDIETQVLQFLSD